MDATDRLGDEAATYAGAVSWRTVLAGFTVLALLPLLFVPVPGPVHPVRELGGFLQTVSFVDHHVYSYLVYVYGESGVGFHLHSVLASPLVVLGYTEGGRLVSLLASVGAAAFLGGLARDLWGGDVGLVAFGLLFANPYYFPFAWSNMPEPVSLLLTTGAIYFVVKYHDEDETRYYTLSLACFVLAVSNSGWEATVALPIAAVLVRKQEWRKTAVLVVSTGLSLALVFFVKRILVPAASSQGPGFTSWELGDVGVWDTGLTPFLSGYWSSHMVRSADNWSIFSLRTWDLYLIGHDLHLVLGVAALVSIAIYAWRRGLAFDYLLLGAWLASALSVPLVLPGFVNHQYVLWGLVAPVTLLLSYGLVRAPRHVEFGSASVDPSSSGRSLSLVSASLLVLLLVSGQVAIAVGSVQTVDGRTHVEPSFNQPPDSRPGEAMRAGTSIRDSHPSVHVEDVVFVGDWLPPERITRSGVGRVVAYGRIRTDGIPTTRLLPRENWMAELPAAGPPACDVAVVLRDDRSVEVLDCDDLSG